MEQTMAASLLKPNGAYSCKKEVNMTASFNEGQFHRVGDCYDTHVFDLSYYSTVICKSGLKL